MRYGRRCTCRHVGCCRQGRASDAQVGRYKPSIEVNVRVIHSIMELNYSDMVIYHPEQFMLFTKGLIGKINGGHIILEVGNHVVTTNFSNNLLDVKQLEAKFNIHLIGLVADESANLIENEHFITITGNRLFDIVDYFYEIENILEELRTFVRCMIFDDEEEAWIILSKMPMSFADGGLNEESCINNSELQSFISKFSYIDTETKYKALYYYDILGLLGDFYSVLMNAGYRFIISAKESHYFLSKKIQKELWMIEQTVKDINSFEIWTSGWQTQKVVTLYMDTIIGIRSIYDILAKLFFEFLRIPTSFTNPVKFASNGKYFSNHRELVGKYDLTNTVFNQADKIEELSIIRNELIHCGSLNPNQKIYIGRNTHAVNNEDIFYLYIMMWDIDRSGNPSRWVNRKRFYSERIFMDDFIRKWFVFTLTEVKLSLNQLITKVISEREGS